MQDLTPNVMQLPGLVRPQVAVKSDQALSDHAPERPVTPPARPAFPRTRARHSSGRALRVSTSPFGIGHANQVAVWPPRRPMIKESPAGK
jgi:hypothetical protein